MRFRRGTGGLAAALVLAVFVAAVSGGSATPDPTGAWPSDGAAPGLSEPEAAEDVGHVLAIDAVLPKPASVSLSLAAAESAPASEAPARRRSLLRLLLSRAPPRRG